MNGALRVLAQRLAEGLGMSPRRLLESRLFESAADDAVVELEFMTEFAAIDARLPLLERKRLAAHRMGEALDAWVARSKHPERRKTGSHFTPRVVAEALIERALSSARFTRSATPSVCDPACGGGAFLIEAGAQFARQGPAEEEAARRAQVAGQLYGIDLSFLSICVAEVALWLFVGDDRAPVSCPGRFVVGDSLLGGLSGVEPPLAHIEAEEGPIQPLHFHRAFPKMFASKDPAGFDWVVGNPPWVAYQGRATVPITAARRTFYREHYAAFTGYPTLHGLFVERAAQLAPRGHVTLLLPSSVSDLDGYRSTRRVFSSTHSAHEPMPEYGQDAFAGVVQPCFGLIASSRKLSPATEHPALDEESLSRPWALLERTHAGSHVVQAAVPEVLLRIDALPALPPETFREVGFQSNRRVATELFLRATEPSGAFQVPLLEGKNVSEFRVGEPKLFLNPDARVMGATRCRLKPREVYEAVPILVRQTAAYPIAALSSGLPFRNSLLGAFETESVDTNLLLGLLNSALYRALHVMRQRDARQAVFPQVKIGHLRRLPAPPPRPAQCAVIAHLARVASEARGLDVQARQSLDDAVFALFDFTSEQARQVRTFLGARAAGALRPGL